MSPVVAAALCLVVYALAYRFYAGYLAEKVFALDRDRVTPAHRYEDGVDYLPTRREVLFGHHFASITGLSPMLGPAIAVIWGWVPGMLWVVGGAILIGCVHDFAALVMSLRARGASIGKLTEGVIGARAKSLFHAVIFFGVALAMGVFVLVIAQLFTTAFYPESVLPAAALVAIAMAMGVAMRRASVGLLPATVVGFVAMLGTLALGIAFPAGEVEMDLWIYGLLGYAYIASVLPVWLLLQPRDFVNSLLLYLGLGLMYLGFFWLRPEFAAPAVDLSPEGAPSIFPFVFIVIACGAASGFHGLVASGTTAKQLDNEVDARPVGYGGMMGESMLGLMAVLACTAGFASPEQWHSHYGSWASAAGLGTKIAAFVEGTARFVSSLGIPHDLAVTFIAVVVVSFALTTLDSATRLLRFNIEEIGETLGAGTATTNRWVTSFAAVVAIGFFAFFEIDGKPAGLALWALFGTVNQLLAGLTLMVATFYLAQRGRNFWVTALPCAFMLVSTLLAMIGNLTTFWVLGTEKGSWLLFGVGTTLLLLALWLVAEAVLCFRRGGGAATRTSMQIVPEEAA